MVSFRGKGGYIRLLVKLANTYGFYFWDAVCFSRSLLMALLKLTLAEQYDENLTSNALNGYKESTTIITKNLTLVHTKLTQYAFAIILAV